MPVHRRWTGRAAVPDYEITIACRVGPVVASCLPGPYRVTPPATVLHLVVSDASVVPDLLQLLTDHHLTPVDLRISPEPV
jgi:hypothetical protein